MANVLFRFGMLDPDEENEQNEDSRPYEPGQCERCTPDRLLDYIREVRAAHRRMPTLAELKQKFGGILGPMVDYWTLQNEGRL
jgi:hypothetical protein